MHGMIIPFFIPHSGCKHQCVFCNQKKITGMDSVPRPECIAEEIRARVSFSANRHDIELAFYGGSFTALPIEKQEKYLSVIRPFIESGMIKSIRISTRPDCINEDILRLLYQYHVRTIELGAQSMDDRVLHESGRGHTTSDTIAASRLIHESGFCLGLQLMAGLAGDDRDGFIRTVRVATELYPAFVRLYPVIVIKDTPLAELYASGRYSPLSLEEAVELCSDAASLLEDKGIKVIRIGLQDADELRIPGTILAGPYHPAFGQLVRSRMLLQKIMRLIAHRGARGDTLGILVNPADLSSAIGQGRANIAALQKEYGLRDVRIISDEAVPKGGAAIAGRY